MLDLSHYLAAARLGATLDSDSHPIEQGEVSTKESGSATSEHKKQVDPIALNTSPTELLAAPSVDADQKRSPAEKCIDSCYVNCSCCVNCFSSLKMYPLVGPVISKASEWLHRAKKLEDTRNEMLNGTVLPAHEQILDEERITSSMEDPEFCKVLKYKCLYLYNLRCFQAGIESVLAIKIVKTDPLVPDL